VAFIPDIVVSLGDPRMVYTCARRPTGSRVFKTSDAGVTWNNHTGDLPANVAPHSMIVDFLVSPWALYLGTDYGVYSSVNDGVNWVKQSGVPNTAIFDLQLDSSGNLVASTHGRGMWRAPVTQDVAVTDEPFGGGFDLGPVAPNPVEVPVAIGFRLPRASAVSLEIFDLLGRRVVLLDSGVRDVGLHQVRWDGRDAAGEPVRGGVYLCRLRAGGVSQTRRLVLIR
jgi:hypothetical protein